MPDPATEPADTPTAIEADDAVHDVVSDVGHDIVDEDALVSDIPADRVPALLESLLFVADGPTEEGALGRALGVPRRELRAGLDALAEALRPRGVRLQRGPDGIQLVTAPDAASYIERFLGLDAGRRLSAAALETLAIVAYRQPVTRGALEAIRGVNCDGAIDTLRNRGLIDIAGRADGPGRPALFATTQKFLEYFGLERPEDLPPLPTEVADAAARLPEHLAQQLPLTATEVRSAAADAPSAAVETADAPPTVAFEPIETAEGRVWPARAGLPVSQAVWLPGAASTVPGAERGAPPSSGSAFSL